jgi:hypothetical protein
MGQLALMLLVKRLVRLKILVISDDTIDDIEVVKPARTRHGEDVDVPETRIIILIVQWGGEPTFVELSLDLQVGSGRLSHRSGNRS